MLGPRRGSRQEAPDAPRDARKDPTRSPARAGSARVGETVLPGPGDGAAPVAGAEFASLADQYGFIVVNPDASVSGQCFGVSSPQALRHDGSSDPASIASMVSYEVQRRGADTDRVFVAGASSGAMTANVLLGDHPDVFKAGAAFMGVPFGCFRHHRRTGLEQRLCQRSDHAGFSRVIQDGWEDIDRDRWVARLDEAVRAVDGEVSSSVTAVARSPSRSGPRRGSTAGSWAVRWSPRPTSRRLTRCPPSGLKRPCPAAGCP
ncbi:esterase, PHB depolymerase family [Streptomyces laurentii]|uniref:Esterase, PHB depolymerase family n=1 Tax=Streptomyces laurentii TaxID=39478 RepID=A0A169N3L4_STRLU|nr:esterase, PHB depolymerase family [Streptomyces laurentii]